MTTALPSTRRSTKTTTEAVSEDGSVTVSFQLVTPALANEWLEFNEKNRNLSEVLAERYARDMAGEKWHIGTSGVGFDTNGQLIDGQHRLVGIIRSGKPVELPVFRGLRPEARLGIDTGRPRSVADEMRMRDMPNSSAAAALTRLTMQYEDHVIGLSQAVQFSPAEILEYATTYFDEVQDAVRAAFRVYAYVKVSMSALGTAYLICSRIDKPLADHYFDKLYIPSELGKDDPILAVRERLQTQQTAKMKMTTAQILWILLRGWNGIRSGEKMRHIKLPVIVTGKNMIEAK